MFSCLRIFLLTSALNAIVNGISPSRSQQRPNRLEKRESPVAPVQASANATGCHLIATDASVNISLHRLLHVDKKSLVEFNLVIPGSATIDARKALDLHEWLRITTSHGRTLAEMGIRHDSLAGLTLSSNSARLVIDLIDLPTGCFLLLGDDERLNAIKYSLVRDFRADGPVTLEPGEQVCHRVVREEFDVDRIELVCYGRDDATGQVVEDCSGANIWLKTLKALLATVRILLYFFGPRLFVPLILLFAKEKIPYVVKLKESICKSVVFCRNDYPLDGDTRAKRSLDLRCHRYSTKLLNSIRHVALGQPVEIKIDQLEIDVDYGRTMVESKVHTGLLESLFKSIFKCSLRDVEPFKSCCAKNALRSCYCCCCCFRRERVTFSWNRCCQCVSILLLVVLIHAPFGLRLVVFYTYEFGSVLLRKNALDRLGLTDSFDGSLFRYLLPTHPFFILVYVLYATTAVIFSIAAMKSKENKFMKIVIGSFKDLRSLEWTEVVRVAVTNLVWPLKRFGFLGFLVGFFYWLVVFPLTVLLLLVYLVPSFYLIMRLVVHSIRETTDKTRIHKEDKPYRTVVEVDRSVRKFILERYLSRDSDEKEDRSCEEKQFWNIDALEKESIEGWDDDLSSTSRIVERKTASRLRTFVCIMVMIVSILALIGSAILLSEILGTVVELLVFLVMGFLVNAAELLKYVVLVFLILTYGIQCYNNVTKKYLKLNKALFKSLGEVLETDLDEITSVPEDKQENRGLKFTREGNTKVDQISSSPVNHWLVHDLVMFIDNHNVPRIPRKLFDQVCLMNVPGIPGPVYESHIEATQQYLKIVVFISFLFIIVLTYGTVYNVSHANQMLATLAGGMLPHILKSLRKESPDEIEIESVTFKNKLGNTIKNFSQYWPVRDFPFELDQNQKSPGSFEVPEASRQVSLTDAAGGEEHILRLTGNMKTYLVREKCLSARFSDSSWPRSLSTDIDLVVYLPEDDIYS